MYKTIVSFRFSCTHQNIDPNTMTAKDLKTFCISEMNEMSDVDIIGSTYIEENTTEKVGKEDLKC